MESHEAAYPLLVGFFGFDSHLPQADCFHKGKMNLWIIASVNKRNKRIKGVGDK